MCSTVQEQITTCGQNAIVKIGERTNIRPQKQGPNQTKMEETINSKSALELEASETTWGLKKFSIIWKQRTRVQV